MDEPIWMDSTDALILHDAELVAHGGSSGIRDLGLLESALARPRNLWAYLDPRPNLAPLAAAYAFGVSANHPFVDGNKRVALVVSFTFLDVNGLEMCASQEDAYFAIMSLATGEMTEDELAGWFERNTSPRAKGKG